MRSRDVDILPDDDPEKGRQLAAERTRPWMQASTAIEARGVPLGVLGEAADAR
jgi:hypothetical protein